METSLEQLVGRAVAGDRTAFTLLLVEHAPIARLRIERRSPRVLLASVGVDDLLQESFTRAIQAMSGFRPVGERAFEHWLCAIADNVVRNAIRERMAVKRGGGRMAGPLESPTGSFDGLMAVLRLDGPTASSVARHRETSNNVQAWLGALPANYRDAVVLRFAQNLPIGQIAARLQTTEKGAEKLLRRGLERLRRMARDSTSGPITSAVVTED